MGKSVLWSSNQGDVVFPITPTSMDGMAIGSSTPSSAKFTSISEVLTALSTAANPTPAGVLTLGSTAAKSYTLGANVTGVDVDIVCIANGTASKKVKAASGVSIFGFLSSAAGSSIAKTSLNFTGKGQAVRLRALSSAVLQVMSKAGAVASS